MLNSFRTTFVLLAVAAAALTEVGASGTVRQEEVLVPAVRSGKMTMGGEYARLRGVNIVAMATGVWREETFRAIRDHAPGLGRFVSPLPGDSYHMTVHPLFTERELPVFYQRKYADRWDAAWDHIVNVLTPHLLALQPHLPGALHPQYVRTLVGNGVTVMMLALPEDEARALAQFRVRVQQTVGLAMRRLLFAAATDRDEREEAQEWYTRLFVEPDAADSALAYAYHLTLGYSRRLGATLTTAELAQLENDGDMVDGVVRNLMCPDSEKPSDPCPVPLNTTDVCWFTSMAAFTPVRAGPRRGTARMFDTLYPLAYDELVGHRLRDTLVRVAGILLLCGIVFRVAKRLLPRLTKRGTTLLPVKNDSHEA